MFKCFFLPSFFFGFAVVNFGALDFEEENFLGGEGEDFPFSAGTKGNQKQDNCVASGRSLNKVVAEQNAGGGVILNENIHSLREIKPVGNPVKAQQEDDFEQLVLYYYIAVSFLLYAYKKVDFTDSFSELGDKQHYKGPVDEDVFAVYKEFSGSDSKGTSTYHDYLSFFCKDALKEFLGVKGKISYSDAYEKMCAMVKDFLLQVEEIDINLKRDGWGDESVQWAFTVALQVFAYKKIYEYLNKSNISFEGNNKNPALQHDLVYVKFLSEMMYNIFKNVLESFSSDSGNTIRSRELFFLSGLKPKNIGPESPRNMFYSAFSNLVFRPAELKGSVKIFLDCFYPIIHQMKK